MIKYYGANVLHDVVDRALQAHGSLGYSTDLPLEAMYRFARSPGSTTDPTRSTVRRWPGRSSAATRPLPTRSRPSTSPPAARRRGGSFADLLEAVTAND